MNKMKGLNLFSSIFAQQKRFIKPKMMFPIKGLGMGVIQGIQMLRSITDAEDLSNCNIMADVQVVVDPDREDQQIRTSFKLPHQYENSKNIAVITTNKDYDYLSSSLPLTVGNKSLALNLLNSEVINFTHCYITSEINDLFLMNSGQSLGPLNLNKISSLIYKPEEIKEEFELIYNEDKIKLKNDKRGYITLFFGNFLLSDNDLVTNFCSVIEYLNSLKLINEKYFLKCKIGTKYGPYVHLNTSLLNPDFRRYKENADEYDYNLERVRVLKARDELNIKSEFRRIRDKQNKDHIKWIKKLSKQPLITTGQINKKNKGNRKETELA